jgi:hypothetical protein
MDETQKSINKMMNISEETWEKHGPVSPESIQAISLKNKGLQGGDELQRYINNLVGISNETWEKYGPK